jgi:hypothetical protein
MDSQTTSVIAYCGFLMSIGTAIIASINHKRLRSSCCKKEVSVSLDIENTSPGTQQNIQNV